MIKKICINQKTIYIDTNMNINSLQFIYSVSEYYRLFVQTKAYKKCVLIKHCLALLCLAQNQHPGKNII